MPIIGTNYDDILFGSELDDEIHGGAGDDLLDGQEGSDLIYGEAGDDTFIGSVGVGNDYYDGGIDRDFITYYDALAGIRVDLSVSSDNARSLVGDSAGIGIDQLVNIEDVEGTRFSDQLKGNASNNLLIGKEGHDAISGDAGDDTLMPGVGDDNVNGGTGVDTADYSDVAHSIYVSLDVTTAQNTGAGRDKLINIENVVGGAFNDILGGNAGNNSLYGLAGADRLIGGAGNDILDGGEGADRMTGGLGNDIFYVDSAADLVFENVGEGTDTVIVSAAMDYTLAANVENLTLTAPSLDFLDDDIEDTDPSLLLSLTGNAGANVLTAAAGTNILDGGAGADRMYGGSGEDLYIVDNVGDVVIEYSDIGTYDEGLAEATDTVQSSVTFTLGNYVENLVLTGTANINGTGNGADNWIRGNNGANILKGGAGSDHLYGEAGNDTLDGGTGADEMYGGAGNDIYIVDDSQDQVSEGTGEGVDTVKASVSYQLQDGVENLTLLGTANIHGWGTWENNVITGNSGSNGLYGFDGDDNLYGGAGDDYIDGGSGNDSIYGGAGRDIFTSGDGADNIYFDDGEFGGTTPSTCEYINDFYPVGGDKIRLDAVDANSNITGDQAFTFIGTGAFSGTAGELRYYHDGVTSFVQGDTNGDGLADFMIGVHNITTLFESDFGL